MDTEAVAVAVKVAAAPAAPEAPEAVLPTVDSGDKSDMPLELAVPPNRKLQLRFAVSEERVLVISVVLEYDTGEAGLVLPEAAETSSFEVDSSDVKSSDELIMRVAVGFVAEFVVGLVVGVKVISDGTGEGGGDESID